MKIKIFQGELTNVSVTKQASLVGGDFVLADVPVRSLQKAVSSHY